MKKDKILRNPIVRILIVLLSIGTFLFAVGALTVLIYLKMFDENPHFTLREVQVKSPGYWNGRDDEITRILGIRKGFNNLFEMDVIKLKKDLLDKKEYSIENVEISEKLPDTILFQVHERIPRALLYNRKSNLLIDGNCVLINKTYCVNINSDIPIITGFKIQGVRFSQGMGKEKIPYGKVLFQLRPAVTLISLINTDYPEFNIKLINIYNANELTVFMTGPHNKRVIRVLLPFKYSKDVPLSDVEFNRQVARLKMKLAELKKLYLFLRWKRKPVREINMLYKGQAVVK